MNLDGTGKKLFLGTYHGRIYLYDSNTLGLLKDLTLYDSGYNETAGAVTALCYSQRDSLLLAVYANGNLKVFNALFRHVQAADASSNSGTTQAVEIRRRPPASPILLRSTNYALAADFSISHLFFSEHTNAVAVANIFGTIWVYAYDTFVLHNVFRVIPPVAAGVLDFKLTDIAFLERLPVLLTTDTSGRISLFRTYPQEPLFIFSWYPCQNPVMENLLGPQSPSTRQSITSFRSRIEATAALHEIKTALIDKLSLPDAHNPSNQKVDMNVQRMIALHSPRLSPTFASNQTTLQQVTIQTKHHGFRSASPQSSKQSQSTSSANKESVILDIKAHWYIFLVNSMGRIIVQDITSLLLNSDLISLVSQYDRDLGDMSVYNIIARLSPTDGCRHIKTFDTVQEMILNPINNDQSQRTVYDISLTDILTVTHWRLEKDGLSSSNKISSNIFVSNLLLIPTSSLPEPYYIAATSETGDVYLWTWNGKRLLGKWRDISSRDQRREEDDGIDLNSDKTNHEGGWRVSGNILVNPFRSANTFSPSNSPKNSGSQFQRFGSDWAAFLEEVHRRGQLKGCKEYEAHISQAQLPNRDKVDRKISSSSSQIPSPERKSQDYSSLFELRKLDDPSADYNTWREALTSTDDLDQEDSTKQKKVTFAAEVEESVRKQQETFNQIVRESLARNFSDTRTKSPRRRVSVFPSTPNMQPHDQCIVQDEKPLVFSPSRLLQNRRPNSAKLPEYRSSNDLVLPSVSSPISENIWGKQASIRSNSQQSRKVSGQRPKSANAASSKVNASPLQSETKPRKEHDQRVEAIDNILNLFPVEDIRNSPGYMLKSPSLRTSSLKLQRATSQDAVPLPEARSKGGLLARNSTISIETYHQLLHGDEDQFISRRNRLGQESKK